MRFLDHPPRFLFFTGAYHRETTRQLGNTGMQLRTPMMQLQDPKQTKVLLVTLASASRAPGTSADHRPRPRHSP